MDRHAPSQELRPQVPTELVFFGGAELIWIDAILLVPAIFGVMFLPTIARAVAISVMLALAVTYFVLYSWARAHRDTAIAHLLDRLHIGPPQTPA
jgi:type VI protein secretion system component VasK